MTFEKRSLSPTVYQIFIILLVVIAGIFWWGYNNNNQIIENQKITIVNLNAELNATVLENAQLSANITTLTDVKTALQTQIQTLTNQTNLLETRVAELNTNVTILNGRIDAQNTQLTENAAKINSLTETNAQLSNQVTTLNGQITTLQGKINNQTAIINLDKSVSLADDQNVTVSASGASYLEYKTNFAGYFSISFTSTSPVQLAIGSSNATNTWYGIYPNVGATSVGSFRMPVMPGTTYIKIVNPSVTDDALIFYYITFYY